MNPIQFACPNCRVELTFGTSGWILLSVVVVLAVAVASLAAKRLKAGRWKLVECGIFFACFLIVLLPIEWLYVRLAKATLRLERAA